MLRGQSGRAGTGTRELFAKKGGGRGTHLVVVSPAAPDPVTHRSDDPEGTDYNEGEGIWLAGVGAVLGGGGNQTRVT